MAKENKRDFFDVNEFTDDQLYKILDLDASSSDRELEAKIIMMIDKYRNMDTKDAVSMQKLFEDIFERFFEVDAEEEHDETDDFENESENIIEGFSGTLTTPLNTEAMVTTRASDTTNLKTENSDNIVTTKSVEIKLDNQNPLLKQTIKRIITVDSSYRENKNLPSTDFTFLLSEPIRNIVSMKLYSVNIPYTWYTISNAFGSNFFYIKGNVDGINSGKHDYKVSIDPGNYTTNDLISAVNNSLQTLNNTYTDISFGTSGITYNSVNALSKLTVDINCQYSESSYYLSFNTTDQVTINNTDVSSNNSQRTHNIASFLGFDNSIYYPYDKYYPFKIKSNTFIYNANSYNNFRYYSLNTSNNYFTIYKYVDTNNYTEGKSVIDTSFNIYFTLTVGYNYTINELITDINKQIQKNILLNSEYSYLQLVTSNETSFYHNESFFELSLKTNRYKTNNLSYSKLRVSFPNESGKIYPIWVGANSCFQFRSNSQEMSNIISDTAPIAPTENYIITTNPYIKLGCIKKYYNVSSGANDYSFYVTNTTQGYSLTDYVSQINNSIDTVNINTITNDNPNGDFYIPNSYALINPDTNYLNIQFDLTKRINTSNFTMDLSGSFFADLGGNFNTTTRYDLSANNVIIATIPYSSLFSISKNKPLVSFYANTAYTNVHVTNDMSFVIYPPSSLFSAGSDIININYANLSATIMDIFKSFTDADGDNIFKNTILSLNLSGSNITATLTVNIQKFLSQKDYSIQFVDVSNINQNSFILDNNTTSSFMSIFGMPNYSYNLSIANEFTYTTEVRPDYNFSYDFSGPLVLKIALNHATIDELNPIVDLYSYTIIPPRKTYTINNLIEMQNDFNALFSSLYNGDLAGTTLTFSVVGSFLKTILSVVINQKYSLGLNNSSWYNNLYISSTMILTPYNLNNTGIYTLSGESFLGVKSRTSFPYTNSIIIEPTNNMFKLVAFEDGVYSSNGTNDITFEIPYDKTVGKSSYNLNQLIEIINTQFSKIETTKYSTVKVVEGDDGIIQYVSFNIVINKLYTAKDFYVSFFDNIGFSTCYKGENTVVNVTWDTTLGWILGYRKNNIYYLSSYAQDPGSVSSMISLTSDTCINTYLYNYFMICLDDYNLNRLNDGVITITRPNTVVSLPSYINQTNYVCDPTTGKITYNTSVKNGYNSLTNNQLYSVTELINSSNTTNATANNTLYSSEPLSKDVFGIIPLKLNGLNPSQTFSEFGGTLQNQERSYFGPVNIFKMSIKLLSDKGTLIDLNGQDWTFSLLVEQIYKKETTSK